MSFPLTNVNFQSSDNPLFHHSQLNQQSSLGSLYEICAISASSDFYPNVKVGFEDRLGMQRRFFFLNLKHMFSFLFSQQGQLQVHYI